VSSTGTDDTTDPEVTVARTGLLIMAHGTPSSIEDIPRFVTELRRGRPPEPELLAELESRYRAIGGASPLRERTRWHADAIADVLEAEAPGRFVVDVGYKFTEPRIEDAVVSLGRNGVHHCVGLVLAPHFSAMSVGDYATRAENAGSANDPPVTISTIPQWHLAPGFVPLMADLVRSEVDKLPSEQRGGTTVLFTAHSLPRRVLEQGDPYADQLRESADAIAAAADVESYMVAWQSAGRSPEPWLGPDILEVIPSLAASGTSTLIVCPVGFVSEHLEVLYDLDVQAASVAEKAGLRFVRTHTLDGDERLSRVIAGIVLEAAGNPAGDPVA